MRTSYSEYFRALRARPPTLRDAVVSGQTGHAVRSAGGQLIVPVVALVESVLHAINSDIAEYVSASTLAQNLTRWPGRPVTLGHPTADGQQSSADAPGIRAAMQVGTVSSAHVDGNRLCMQIAIDPARCEALGAHEMLHRLRAGGHVEVSVGVFAATAAQAGSFGGRPYTRAWTSLLPDHLALLDGVGACSYADGCGAHRAASYFQHSEGDPMEDLNPAPDGYADGLAELKAANDPDLQRMRAATATHKALRDDM